MLGLALTALVLLRFGLIPTEQHPDTFRDTAGTVVDTLIAAAVGGLLVGLAYVRLFPRDPDPELASLDPRVIGETIEMATRVAREWRVRARTANYFSRATLPWLTKSALQHGGEIRVRMQVLDPDNERLMSAYARFRSNHPGAAARWTPARVRNEIYASLLQAALCRCDAPRLDIEVGLSPAFWVVSLDITDNFALLTGQNKGDPALIFRNDSPFLDSWNDDFQASFTECRIVTPRIDGLKRDDLVSPTPEVLERLHAFFAELKLERRPDHVIKEILQALGDKHHYA